MTSTSRRCRACQGLRRVRSDELATGMYPIEHLSDAMPTSSSCCPTVTASHVSSAPFSKNTTRTESTAHGAAYPRSLRANSYRPALSTPNLPDLIFSSPRDRTRASRDRHDATQGDSALRPQEVPRSISPASAHRHRQYPAIPNTLTNLARRGGSSTNQLRKVLV